MKEILFYKNKSGKSPIEVFLDSLSLKEVEKVIWVLQLIEESHRVSTKNSGDTKFRGQDT